MKDSNNSSKKVINENKIINIKEEVLQFISKEKNIYLNNIKNGTFKNDYENILNIIDNSSKNISSFNISQLIDNIQKYINIYEDDPLNKIKLLIMEYNQIN